jgi:hypothetical protein
MNLGDKALLHKFQDILADMNDHKYIKQLSEAISNPEYDKIPVKENETVPLSWKIPKSLYFGEVQASYKFLYTWSQQIQEIIIWIINMPKEGGKNYLHRSSQWTEKDMLIERYKSLQTWLDDISYLLTLYTKTSNTIKNYSENTK